MNYLIEVLENVKNETKKGIFRVTSEKQVFFSYSSIYTKALNKSKEIREKIGSRKLVIITDESSFDFIIDLWATFLSDNIPVPFSIENRGDFNNFKGIWEKLNKPYIVSNNSYVEEDKIELNFEMLDEMNNAIVQHEELSKNIAMIMFSSGSTSTPKGSILTFENVKQAEKVIVKKYNFSSKDSFVNWMPLTHAIGLNVFHLLPIIVDSNQFQFDKKDFIINPDAFIKTIESNNVNVTIFPEFGFKIISKLFKTTSERYDLSSLKLVFGSSEIMTEKVINDFYSEARKFGLKNKTVKNLYGMTESVLGIASTDLNEEINFIKISRTNLEIGNEIVVDNENGVPFISSGTILTTNKILIVDDNQKKLPFNHIGNILVKGSNISQGYYKENNDLYYKDGYLNSGDIGFVDNENKLYIISRKKDVLISNGKNFYVLDIENFIVEKFPDLQNKFAVTSVYNSDFQEKVNVGFIIGKENQDMERRINSLLLINLGITLNKFIFVKSFPTEKSGKLSRKKLGSLYKVNKVDLVETKKVGSDIEQKLVNIIKEIVGIDSVGKDTDLLSLGVNSISLIKITEKLRIIFEVDIELSELVENLTINNMKKIIQHNQNVSKLLKSDVNTEKLKSAKMTPVQ